MDINLDFFKKTITMFDAHSDIIGTNVLLENACKTGTKKISTKVRKAVIKEGMSSSELSTIIQKYISDNMETLHDSSGKKMLLDRLIKDVSSTFNTVFMNVIKNRMNQTTESWVIGDMVTTAPSKLGMFSGKNKKELKAEYDKLLAAGPHKRGSADYTKMKELSFAIRAKSGWGKV